MSELLQRLEQRWLTASQAYNQNGEERVRLTHRLLERALAVAWEQYLPQAQQIVLREVGRDGPFIVEGEQVDEAEGERFCAALEAVRTGPIIGSWSGVFYRVGERENFTPGRMEGFGQQAVYRLDREKVQANASQDSLEELAEQIEQLDAESRPLHLEVRAAAQELAGQLIDQLVSNYPMARYLSFWAGWPSALLDVEGRPLLGINDAALASLAKGGPYWRALADVGWDEEWRRLLEVRGLKYHEPR